MTGVLIAKCLNAHFILISRIKAKNRYVNKIKIKINKLTENPESRKIYDHIPPPDLIHSIKENGVLQPIWITKEGKIISGHRRVNVCKILDIEEIPYEIKEDSLLLVLETNRYREKTWQEKLNEAEAIEKICKVKAKEQQIRKPY